jgi:hypothetical protein
MQQHSRLKSGACSTADAPIATVVRGWAYLICRRE